MAAVHRVRLEIPLDNDTCEIEVDLPGSLVQDFSIRKAAQVIAMRLVSSHGLPCFVLAPVEAALAAHLQRIQKVGGPLFITLHSPLLCGCVGGGAGAGG